MKKLLLFDIDSTLITMKRSAQRAIMRHAALQAFGYEIPESAVPPLSGKTDRQIIAEIVANLALSTADIETVTQKFLSGLREITPIHSTSLTVSALSGARELIEYCHEDTSVALALVTGNNRECAYFKLAPIGLERYFPIGAFGCDHHDRRMLPPLAMERAHSAYPNAEFTPQNTLVIGDAPGDIACAQANGIPILAVATGRYSADELRALGADAVVADFSDRAYIISTINSLVQ